MFLLNKNKPVSWFNAAVTNAIICQTRSAVHTNARFITDSSTLLLTPPPFPGCLTGKHHAKKKKNTTHTQMEFGWPNSMTERDCHHSRLQQTWKMGFCRRRASCRGNIADVLERGMKVRVLYLRTAPSAPPGGVQIRSDYQTWSGVLGRGGESCFSPPRTVLVSPVSAVFLLRHRTCALHWHIQTKRGEL